MYQISVSPAVRDTLQRAATFFHHLKNGEPCTWDDFTSPEVSVIQEQWKKLEPLPHSGTALAISSHLTGVQLRSLTRALSAFVAAQDGRYSLLVDYLASAFCWHPAPFMLAHVFAEAEQLRFSEGSKGRVMSGLDAETDAEVRKLLAILMSAMTPPGQALEIDLPDFGIFKIDTRAPDNSF